MELTVENNVVVINLTVDQDSEYSTVAYATRAEAAADEAKKIAKRYNFITPNMFVNEGMTDQQKIQEALWWARQKKKSLYIPWNEERESDIWLLDEAVLLESNSIIYIDNARLKLSDIARDNIFRSANCGYGIENPHENILNNISIIGVGNAVLEGADNPRASGDSGKPLSVDVPTYDGTTGTYGTDALNPSEKQTGDWRNIGLLLAYTQGIKIDGVSFKDLHGYAASIERCKSGILQNIHLDNDENRVYGGSNQIIRNTDGINIRQAGEDFVIQNIFGISGDDPVALSMFNGDIPAGTFDTMSVTGSIHDPDEYIRNVRISNVRASTYANIVRLLNTNGTKMYNVVVRDIFDTTVPEKLTRTPVGSAVLIGSNNAVYGGPTEIGDCRDITIDNVKTYNNAFAIRVVGSIAESSITNIWKYSSPLQTIQRPAIYFDPNSDGFRNLYRANIFNDDAPELSTLDGGSWLGCKSDGRLQVINGPVDLSGDFSNEFSDLSLVPKKFVTDIVPAIIHSINTAPGIIAQINNRATSEGFAIPPASVQKAIAELIGGLIATGFWDKQDLFLNFAYGNPLLSNYSRINWKNPEGALATVHDGITLEEGGWKGDGISGYISTQFNPSTDSEKYTLNNAGRGLIVYERAGNSAVEGATGDNTNSILLQNNNGQRINCGSNTLDSNVNLDGVGYKGINRDNDEVVRLYNRDVESVRQQLSTSIGNNIQVILRRNASYGSSTVSMYHLGASLTKDETIGLRSYYNDFLRKLGLNPIA